MEHCPVRNLQHKTFKTTFDMFNQSQDLLCTLTNPVFHCSCVFTIVEIIKHDMLNMLLFSSIFNIKMATQKFTSFDVLLKMRADMTQSRYSLTKLFRMKLNIAKCFRIHLMETNELAFGRPAFLRSSSGLP